MPALALRGFASSIRSFAATRRVNRRICDRLCYGRTEERTVRAQAHRTGFGRCVPLLRSLTGADYSLSLRLPRPKLGAKAGGTSGERVGERGSLLPLERSWAAPLSGSLPTPSSRGEGIPRSRLWYRGAEGFVQR